MAETAEFQGATRKEPASQGGDQWWKCGWEGHSDEASDATGSERKATLVIKRQLILTALCSSLWWKMELVSHEIGNSADEAEC